jgi:ferredoxin-NADP reductase
MVILGKNNDTLLMNNWKVATLIKSEMAAQDIKSLTFSVANWQIHKPGQHYSIRLTAEDGYQAERDYSIASPPEQKNEVEFGVQLLENGEVSPYLFNIQIGEQIELEGPIGGHFIWDSSSKLPLILIAGGSGIVPMMSILRHHYLNFKKRKIILLLSFRTIEKIPYYNELLSYQQKDPNLELVITLTDNHPHNWMGLTERLDKRIIKDALLVLKDDNPDTYICGPTNFVENIADILLELTFNRNKIKTERFG